MKKIITLTLCLSFLPSFFAQKLDYDHDSKWFFGINAGGTWQTTDVKDKLYIGYGATLGRSFNYNYGKKFSFDLRLRYLGGKWYGQDYDTTNVTGNPGYETTGNVVQKYDTTLGYTINNFQAQVHELGLELVLHANGLRERTGWDPYIFGGVNAVWNQTFGDLYSQDSTVLNNQYYNYSTSGMGKGEWKGLSDESYDSALDGSDQKKYNVNFMPSIGIGLAYQVGPRFSIGLEHKTTFALKDNFDGYKNSTKRWGMFKNDIYHYTSLMLKFNFRSKKVDEAIEEVNNDCLKPAIGIVTPIEKTITVSSLKFDLEALISQVSGKSNIQLSLNGVRDTNFIYTLETSKLKTNITLVDGQNTILITASNGCGKATETINVLYEKCVPPTVSFLNAPTLKVTTNDNSYTVTAKLERAKKIVYSINGRELKNYNFNEEENMFSSTISLIEGVNNIKIAVSNECGTDEQTVEITYVRCDKPVIKINSSDRALKTDKNSYSINALLENVISKSQISLKLNNQTKSFSYNVSRKELSQKVTLKEGLNVIEIKASNNCGEESKTISIEYIPCITPSIAMISPVSSSIKTEQSKFAITAKIENILNASQVNVNFNGKSLSTGSYNASSDTFKKELNLIIGTNNVILTVSTDCGNVSSNFSIIRRAIDNDMTICFKGQTLVIKESQWSSYRNQGAIQGECPKPVDNDMTICFTGQTLVIKESQWKSYSLRGAIQGECPKPVDNDMTVCFKGQTLVIKESQWKSYSLRGAVQGECPKPVDKKVEICFNGKKLTINESQLTAYLKQGAIEGDCPEPESEINIIICYKGQTLTVKESEWENYNKLGAIRGECVESTQDKKITICHTNPLKPEVKETMVILESEWAQHQEHGDKLGACVETDTIEDSQMIICLNGETKTILKSEWMSYRRQGAKMGDCN